MPGRGGSKPTAGCEWSHQCTVGNEITDQIVCATKPATSTRGFERRHRSAAFERPLPCLPSCCLRSCGGSYCVAPDRSRRTTIDARCNFPTWRASCLGWSAVTRLRRVDQHLCHELWPTRVFQGDANPGDWSTMDATGSRESLLCGIWRLGQPYG